MVPSAGVSSPPGDHPIGPGPAQASGADGRREWSPAPEGEPQHDDEMPGVVPLRPRCGRLPASTGSSSHPVHRSPPGGSGREARPDRHTVRWRLSRASRGRGLNKARGSSLAT